MPTLTLIRATSTHRCTTPVETPTLVETLPRTTLLLRRRRSRAPQRRHRRHCLCRRSWSAALRVSVPPPCAACPLPRTVSAPLSTAQARCFRRRWALSTMQPPLLAVALRTSAPEACRAAALFFRHSCGYADEFDGVFKSTCVTVCRVLFKLRASCFVDLHDTIVPLPPPLRLHPPFRSTPPLLFVTPCSVLSSTALLLHPHLLRRSYRRRRYEACWTLCGTGSLLDSSSSCSPAELCHPPMSRASRGHSGSGFSRRTRRRSAPLSCAGSRRLCSLLHAHR
jgi:hypothetical protein